MKIVVDGNIGSGKTTQLGLLEKKGWHVQREPIDSWPLEDFYKDPKRWAFYFHMVILRTLRPVKTPKPVIYERSLMSSRWVFWPVLKRQGHVTPGEDETYAWFYDQCAWYPDLYIFLSKDRTLALKHIQSRKQAGDAHVTKEYLAELDTEYLRLLQNMPCKVHVVNANQTVEKIHEDICKILVENELFINNALGSQVQKEGRRGWQMSCARIENVCRVS